MHWFEECTILLLFDIWWNCTVFVFATYIVDRVSKVTLKNCRHIKGSKYRPLDQGSQSMKEKETKQHKHS